MKRIVEQAKLEDQISPRRYDFKSDNSVSNGNNEFSPPK